MLPLPAAALASAVPVMLAAKAAGAAVTASPASAVPSAAAENVTPRCLRRVRSCSTFLIRAIFTFRDHFRSPSCPLVEENVLTPIPSALCWNRARQ